MINIFKKRVRLQTHKEHLYNFKVGLVVKMEVGSRSHVDKPYYVEITQVNPHAKEGEIIMTTSIPGYHSLSMSFEGFWNYHYERMQIIGSKESFGSLLLNQDINHVR